MSNEEQILILKSDALYWKRVASYLADCHAATADRHGRRKSCSKSGRQRLVDICGIAADMLEGKPTQKSLHREDAQEAANRCRRLVAEMGEDQ